VHCALCRRDKLNALAKIQESCGKRRSPARDCSRGLVDVHIRHRCHRPSHAYTQRLLVNTGAEVIGGRTRRAPAIRRDVESHCELNSSSRAVGQMLLAGSRPCGARQAPLALGPADSDFLHATHGATLTSGRAWRENTVVGRVMEGKNKFVSP
jgi:hypothetical protein